jgi:hypothetical protein
MVAVHAFVIATRMSFFMMLLLFSLRSKENFTSFAPYGNVIVRIRNVFHQ